MQRRHLLLTALALTATLRADVQENTSMLYARQAAAMLGPTLWKQVLRVHNTSKESRYPKSFGAVVFEMGGILWFYTATDGTQSLSIRLGRAKEDEQDLGPLLSNLDAGFTHWEADSGAHSPGEKSSIPPNACFIQSVALLRSSLSLGIRVERARLLSYYVSYPTGLRGHTVLFLETDKGPTVIDPLMQRRPLHVRGADTGDPKCVAYCIRHDVALARWVPISPGDFPVSRDEGAHFSNN
jgi:hypothetical protein